MPERIQKIIANSGLMSRRAAEEAILAGRVRLNGKTAVIGEKAEEGEEILLDGKPLPQQEEKSYFLLHKPRGYVCSLQDEKGRRSVRELLPKNAGRVYPVGRLDLMSEGLLLMTNDGDFAYRMSHPSGEQSKSYLVTVEGDKLEQAVIRLREPFLMDGAEVCALAVTEHSRDGQKATLEITVGEGRNREIRRMCEEAQLHVLRLIRVREGPFELGDLPCGKARRLKREEVDLILKDSGA